MTDNYREVYKIYERILGTEQAFAILKQSGLWSGEYERTAREVRSAKQKVNILLNKMSGVEE